MDGFERNKSFVDVKLVVFEPQGNEIVDYVNEKLKRFTKKPNILILIHLSKWSPLNNI